MKKFLIFFIYSLILILLQACAAGKSKQANRFLGETFNGSFFENQFTGILVTDPQSGDTIYRQQETKYFTPASNTKIFTLYSAMKLLPEFIPTLRYKERNDTLFIAGSGDPATLHPYFKDSSLIKFISTHPNVALYSGNFRFDHWGPGWAWEDYDGYYSPERNALPLYGNVLEVYKGSDLEVSPAYFKDSVHPVQYTYRRLRKQNSFFFDPGRTDTLLIPFQVDTSLTRRLLEEATGRRILFAKQMPEGPYGTVYGIASDSLYKRMMQESDNFLAEQLLVAASGMLSDTLDIQNVLEHTLEVLLPDLPQTPVWVDGSGLSRYNLFSPADLVYVLTKLWREYPRQRLLPLFAAGGDSGTLEDWYAGDNKPYLFAKTGSLANNHCLSGYLETKSGKFLIFSMMHNHFTVPSSSVKAQMQRVLEWLRDTY